MRHLLTFAFLLLTAPAFAHIVADPNTGSSGAWFHTVLRVPHGCESKDTTALTVTVPDDILIIKPQVKTGWTLAVKKHALAKPVQGPHGMITEKTDSITWKDGTLPDQYFDDFGLTMKLPETKAPNISFTITQQCGDTSITWQPGNAEHPAPVVTITPAKTDAHEHHH